MLIDLCHIILNLLLPQKHDCILIFQLLKECADLLNEDHVVQGLLHAVTLINDIPIIQPVSQICHNLLMSNKLAAYEYK